MSKITKLDGKTLSTEILSTQHTNNMFKRPPTLVIITIGKDPASKVYVANKLRACEKCGINVIHTVFDSDTTKTKLANYIWELNTSDDIDGIIIQQPIPTHLKGVEQLVEPTKDVDGFTRYNLGNTLTNKDNGITACTPKGIMTMLHMYGIDLTGKHVTIIGRSEIVGKPLIGLLLKQNATVTSCNSYTENLKEILSISDIIISAIGKAKYITREFLTPRTHVIIDVGINRDESNKLCGDCDYVDITDYWTSLEDEEERFITPVPGGVGPMTVATLIQNVNIAYNDHVVNKMLGV